jgi:redox-sensitive bicupin YhaK (pirin superfamily)
MSASSIELVLVGRARELGGFSVRRVLPAVQRRLVGPFIFWDHMGPVALSPGEGFDVRPHPHIGLATVTYLFEGEIIHRDSVGSDRAIYPGDVNWMTAGRGIAHSERASDNARREGIRLHGIQSWVALPLEHEETAPAFEHHPRASLPRIERDGVTLDVIAGTAYGATSPVKVFSPTIYVHAQLPAGTKLPIDAGHEERAVYVVEGAIRCDGETFGAATLVMFRPGADAVIEAETNARVMLLGGAHIEGHREIWWNFVSSSKERIERAKADWQDRRFAPIPGDNVEFIPLPER